MKDLHLLEQREHIQVEGNHHTGGKVGIDKLGGLAVVALDGVGRQRHDQNDQHLADNGQKYRVPDGGEEVGLGKQILEVLQVQLGGEGEGRFQDLTVALKGGDDGEIDRVDEQDSQNDRDDKADDGGNFDFFLRRGVCCLYSLCCHYSCTSRLRRIADWMLFRIRMMNSSTTPTAVP